MNNQVVHDLINFNTACDEFVNGKYILADVKISSLLNIIAEDEKLRNIVASTLEDYDFKEKLINATKSEGNGYVLILPTDEKEIIAFVYSLFYRFNNKTIDFYDFISQYYKSDDENPGKEFYNFANAIITPFKNAINSIYSKRHVIVEADDYQKNYYNKLITTVKLIVKNIDNYKLKMNEKEEFTMLLNSLYLASQKNDKKLVFSLMVALDYFSRCNKKTRNAYLMLEECFTTN
ncbi:MAG TPA: hypothetical protein IAB72_03130 [Candidatus Onthoplasma faecipullorum]|nr:hypothetical protein [Candidatus Onthoplasma faecipullorum]